MAMIRRILAYRILPVAFTLFTIILLCLPGSMVPGTGIFGMPNLDKVVHVILFGTNVLFWGWHFSGRNPSSTRLRTIVISTAAAIIILGIVLEYVQLYFIPNRSFDNWDIVADAAGAILAGTWLLAGRKIIRN